MITEPEARIPGADSGPEFLLPLAESIGRHADAKSVFGEPVVHGEVTIIPVATARWGLGGGTNRRSEESQAGSGGGGGMIVHPVGYIEIAGGTTRFRPIRDPLRLAPVLLGAGSLVLLALRAWMDRRSSRARE